MPWHTRLPESGISTPQEPPSAVSLDFLHKRELTGGPDLLWCQLRGRLSVIGAFVGISAGVLFDGMHLHLILVWSNWNCCAGNCILAVNPKGSQSRPFWSNNWVIDGYWECVVCGG